MSLPALQTSAGAAPAPSANHAHDAAAKSSGGETFAAIFTALSGETPQSNPKSASTKETSTAKGDKSAQDEASKAKDGQSIDSDLAGLVFGALPTAGSGVAGSKGSAPANLTAATPAPVTPATPLWRAQASAALTASSAVAGATASASLAALSIDPKIAALASAAAESTAPSFVNAGALEQPQEAASLANTNAALTFTVAQQRTHLGVDGAAQMEAKDPILRAQSGASLAAQAATAQVVTGQAAAQTAADQGDPAASATLGKASVKTPANANRDATQAAAQAATRVSVSQVAATASAKNEAGSERGSSRGSSQAAPAAGLAANATGNAAASLAVNAAATASAVVSLGPITPGQLADALATQARDLVSAAPSSDAPGTAKVAGSQPVKELEIRLDPADLGAVSVKMRLSDGKLSVVMEVSKPSTLKAVESDRDAIAARLGSSVQSLESLVIKPSTANNQTAGGGSAASGQNSGGRDDAQSDSRGSADSRSGQQAPNRDGSADPWSRQAPSNPPVAGRGFGDMVV